VLAGIADELVGLLPSGRHEPLSVVSGFMYQKADRGKLPKPGTVNGTATMS
jgi:hypothetical protein